MDVWTASVVVLLVVVAWRLGRATGRRAAFKRTSPTCQARNEHVLAERELWVNAYDRYIEQFNDPTIAERRADEFIEKIHAAG